MEIAGRRRNSQGPSPSMHWLLQDLSQLAHLPPPVLALRALASRSHRLAWTLACRTTSWPAELTYWLFCWSSPGLPLSSSDGAPCSLAPLPPGPVSARAASEAPSASFLSHLGALGHLCSRQLKAASMSPSLLWLPTTFGGTYFEIWRVHLLQASWPVRCLRSEASCLLLLGLLAWTVRSGLTAAYKEPASLELLLATFRPIETDYRTELLSPSSRPTTTHGHVASQAIVAIPLLF